MDGTSASSFSPEAPASRGMVITVLYRLSGAPAVSGSSSFTDLTADWYKPAVQWAYENGIANGVSESAFAPNASITRQELVTMLYRYEQKMSEDVSKSSDLNAYSDAGSIDAWALDAMKWAVGSGVVSGESATILNPLGVCSRAALATMLMNLK